MKIPTTYIGYDFTFSNGKNIWDHVGLGPMKKTPEILRDSDDENSDDAYWQGADATNYVINNEQAFEISDCESDLDKKEYNSDTDNESSTISSISDSSHPESKQNDVDDSIAADDLRLVKKRRRSKFTIQYFLTGNDLEFVYDIIWYPGLYKSILNLY